MPELTPVKASLKQLLTPVVVQQGIQCPQCQIHQNTLLRGLNHSEITFPVYQRDFVWSVPMMKQLRDDLVNHLIANQQTQIQGQGPPNRYFLGNMIMQQGNLVDGQQRIVALTVMIVALRDSLIGHNFIDMAHELNKLLCAHNNAGRLTLKVIPNQRNSQKERMEYLVKLEHDFNEQFTVDAQGGNGGVIHINQIQLPWDLHAGDTFRFRIPGGGNVDAIIDQFHAKGAQTQQLVVQPLAQQIPPQSTAEIILRKGTSPHRWAYLPLKRAYDEMLNFFNDFIEDLNAVAFPPPANQMGAFLSPNHNASNHQDNKTARAENLVKLLEEIQFAVTMFENQNEAMKYFGLMNDPARKTDLSCLDLVLAAIHEVTMSHGYNAWNLAQQAQNQIYTTWESIYEKLYVSQNFNLKHSTDFFVSLLLSDGHTDGASRYSEKTAFKGLDTHYIHGKCFDKWIGWDFDLFLTQLKTIDKMADWYNWAVKEQSLPLTVGPPNNPVVYTQRSSEIVMLNMLTSCGFKQFIPLYLAACRKFELLVNQRDNKIRDLLKFIVHLYLRGKSIDALIKTAPNKPPTPQELQLDPNHPGTPPMTSSGLDEQSLYSKISNWIGSINGIQEDAAGNITPQAVNAVLNNIKNGIKQGNNCLLGPHKPWGNVQGGVCQNFDEGLDRLYSVNNTQQLKFYLLCYERALWGGGHNQHTLAGIWEKKKEIEHILPQNYNQVDWGRVDLQNLPQNLPNPALANVGIHGFTQAEHDDRNAIHQGYVHWVGNRTFIEKEINSHISDDSFLLKMQASAPPPGFVGNPNNWKCAHGNQGNWANCGKHYPSSWFRNSKISFGPQWANQGLPPLCEKWSPDEIKERGRHMIKTIIGFWDI